MKKTLPIQIWEIIYPLGIYFVAANIAMFLAQMLFGSANESYMLCQIVASCFTIPFVYRFFRQDQILMGILKPKPWISREHLENVLWIIPIAALIGIGLNNIIQMSPLVHLSETYLQMNQAFYASSMGLELLGSAVVTPLLEELLYRGVIYGRLRRMMKLVPAVLISAVIFGAVHFNVVQFVYAFLLGIVLALCMEKSGHMYGAVVAHMTANGIAVIRTETGFLQQTAEAGAGNILFSIGCFVAGILLLVFYLRRKDSNIDQ